MMEKLKSINWRNVILFLFVMVGLLVLAQSFVLPNMVGWDAERVKHYEAGNDIDIDYRATYSDTVDYGIVTEQEKCAKEDKCDVILTFSKGKDVSSQSEEEIKDYLEELVDGQLIDSKQIVYNEPEYSNEVNQGYPIVYDANPYEGTIQITFSKGPEVHVYEASMVGVGDI